MTMFAQWTTPLICDAALRLELPFAVVEPPLEPAVRGMRACGPARPVTHLGSVDVFLEAIDQAARGDLLVIDNGGRGDEGCIGELVALEAASAGLAGIVCWGRHRDSADLQRIALPVFSLGTCPAGPRELRESAGGPVRLASTVVRPGDWVFADDDGVVAVGGADVNRLAEQAEAIYGVERRQAERVAGGVSLRAQLRFADYLARRDSQPGLTFREHLRAIGGAIEE